jgi:hypothetical protein
MVMSKQVWAVAACGCLDKYFLVLLIVGETSTSRLRLFSQVYINVMLNELLLRLRHLMVMDILSAISPCVV